MNEITVGAQLYCAELHITNAYIELLKVKKFALLMKIRTRWWVFNNTNHPIKMWKDPPQPRTER